MYDIRVVKGNEKCISQQYKSITCFFGKNLGGH